jgi:large subunit ribosomal protein L6
MSRIGKQPIEIPEDVDVSIDGQDVTITGPVGEVSREVSDVVEVRTEDGEILVERPDDSREARSHQGLVRSLLSNMVEGASEGFTKRLEINGVGYRAERYGEYIRFELGFSHPVLFEIHDQIEIEIESQTSIELESADNELLGQVAAKIRNLRPPEPYKGKGIKYADEQIRRKVGKAGVS